MSLLRLTSLPCKRVSARHHAVGLVDLAGGADGGVEVWPLLRLGLGLEEVTNSA